jgi:hypothetical protein
MLSRVDSGRVLGGAPLLGRAGPNPRPTDYEPLGLAL